MAFTVVEFGFEAYEGLGDFAGSMGFPCFLFASVQLLEWDTQQGDVLSFMVVKTSSMTSD